MSSSPDKRQAKYYGLVNQGATCYLNSILQVLFMTKDFRQIVKSYEPANVGTGNIDSDLKDLFLDLEKKNSHTHRITNKLRIKNVYEQRDAAELYEKILRLTSPNASKIFHGELINRSTCQKCCNVTESAVGFWDLPLPLIQNNSQYSVESSINEFFRSSMITGDNQMYCEDCDGKSDALLECEVKYYPEVLVLLLKRFEIIYDGYSGRKVKINCPVKMSDTLHITHNIDKKRYTYKMYAFVEHFGDLKSGHYTSKIKPPDKKQWYIFDDLNVEKCHYQHFQLDQTEMSDSVYLLFYRHQKGDTSLTNLTRPDTWESRLATVTNGNKTTHRSTEEEEEREKNTTRTTELSSAFSKGYGATGKLISPARKRRMISEESKPTMEHPDVHLIPNRNDQSKEAKSVKDISNKTCETQHERDKKFHKKAKVSDVNHNSECQTHTDSVIIQMPAKTHKKSSEREEPKRRDCRKPNVEISKSGFCGESNNFERSPPNIRNDRRSMRDNLPMRQQSKQVRGCSGQGSPVKNCREMSPFSQPTYPSVEEPSQKAVQSYSASNRQREVTRSSSYTPTHTHGNEFGHPCMSQSGERGRKERFSVRSNCNVQDRGITESERISNKKPTERHSFHGKDHKYRSQDYQLETFKRELGRNERKHTQNENYRQSHRQKTLHSQPQTTPQQCLERVKEQHKPKSGHDDSYSIDRKRDSADYKFKTNRSPNYSPQNDKGSFRDHTNGNRNPEAALSSCRPAKEENILILHDSQTPRERQALNKEHDTSKRMSGKKKYVRWLRRLFCIPSKRGSTK